MSQTGKYLPRNWLTGWVPQYKRDYPKTGRNEPCPCGSGNKYKKCCKGKSK